MSGSDEQRLIEYVHGIMDGLEELRALTKAVNRVADQLAEIKEQLEPTGQELLRRKL